MRRTYQMAVAAAAAAALTLTACGSDDESGEGGGGGGGASAGGTVKLGVLTPVSGGAAAGFTGTEEGVNARLEAYKAADGQCADTDFEIVMGDDTSSPQGALAAAQKMVLQDQVYAILPVTPFLTGASTFLATQAADTPVVGASFDGSPQWLDESVGNFFSANGSSSTENIPSTFGEYWSAIGGTRAAVVAPDAPVAADGAAAVMESATTAGLEEAYLNTSLPIGSTDVGAIVLGIRDSGADVLYLPVTPETGFAIVAGLRQAGIELKSILLPTGYGADLLASPPALAAAEGVGFLTNTTPAELDTDATRFQGEALQKYAGSESGIPSLSQQQGWQAADLFLYGLDAAGCDASQADYMTTLRESADWDSGGLYPNPVDFSERGNLAPTHAPGNCFYVSIVRNGAFVPDENAAPICGDLLN
jgi:ABC-type branched-subunit amino acid transport system substrate-binding protein